MGLTWALHVHQPLHPELGGEGGGAPGPDPQKGRRHHQHSGLGVAATALTCTQGVARWPASAPNSRVARDARAPGGSVAPASDRVGLSGFFALCVMQQRQPSLLPSILRSSRASRAQNHVLWVLRVRVRVRVRVRARVRVRVRVGSGSRSGSY